MKEAVEKSKKYLYLYAKERYLWEHCRKNELNSSAVIPLGILTIQISGLSYFLLDISLKAKGIVVVVCLIILCVSILVSIVLFIKHQTGYTYGYILSPKSIATYYKNLISAYEDNKEDVDYAYINDHLKEKERDDYIEATERNILNNNKKNNILPISTVFINNFIVPVGSRFVLKCFCRELP